MQTLQQLKSDQLSPFVRRLVENEPRFRFHGFGNDLFKDKKFFVITKEFIHTPNIFPQIEHEIAHAVEMANKKRWLLPDWGMSVKGFLDDEPISAKKFFASMSREMRARAIQIHMNPEHLNYKTSTMYNILNNGFWESETKKHLPFGRFKKYQDVQDWIHDFREKTYRAWSLERIEHEWFIRLRHMQEWMETK